MDNKMSSGEEVAEQFEKITKQALKAVAQTVIDFRSPVPECNMSASLHWKQCTPHLHLVI
jgi:hypothetical protein